MRYFESYRYLFHSPKWLANLGLCIVASLVPIAGQMVILGYHFEIIEALHLKGEKDYPDFDLNRLLNYLLRGAWVFLVHMILGLPLIIVFLIAYFAVWLGVFGLVAPNGPFDPTTATVLLGCGSAGFVLFFLLSVIEHLLLVPMSLRAGLSQDFKAAFNGSFIRDFLGRVFWPTLLAWLFLFVSGFVIGCVGYLAFCVGILPAAALIGFADTHLKFQLYQLYLERGGTAIPLAVRPAEEQGAYEEN
jgi:hypothetical protein